MFGSLKQYVFSGVSRHYKDETNRRIMVVNLFAAVGMSITFLLGSRAFIDGEYSLSTTLFTASVVFAIFTGGYKFGLHQPKLVHGL